MEVGRTEEFEVKTLGAGGKGILDISVTGPNQRLVNINKKELQEGTKFSFTPTTEGENKNCIIQYLACFKGTLLLMHISMESILTFELY